jgi:hypothetical protein
MKSVSSAQRYSAKRNPKKIKQKILKKVQPKKVKNPGQKTLLCFAPWKGPLHDSALLNIGCKSRPLVTGIIPSLSKEEVNYLEYWSIGVMNG